MHDTSQVEPVKGRVASWHDEEGWGVITSDATPGGCWVHVSSVVAGGRSLVAGQEVSFTFETAQQDGFGYRAVEAWPADGEPDRSHRVYVDGPTAAYRSGLTLSFHDERGAEV